MTIDYYNERNKRRRITERYHKIDKVCPTSCPLDRLRRDKDIQYCTKEHFKKIRGLKIGRGGVRINGMQKGFCYLKDVTD